MTLSVQPAPRAESDAELAARISAGDERAFEDLMRRCNGRLFRVARSILKDDADAEDALQEAYLQAHRRMQDFRGDAQLTTWLTRIVINQALMQARRMKRDSVVVPFSTSQASSSQRVDMADLRTEPAPLTVLRAELRRLLERQIDELPAAFRTVFVMREVEQLTVEETAECLSIPAATVRTRLFRARALLRQALAHDLDAASADVFGFAGDRCDRIVARVLTQVRAFSEGGNAGA